MDDRELIKLIKEYQITKNYKTKEKIIIDWNVLQGCCCLLFLAMFCRMHLHSNCSLMWPKFYAGKDHALRKISVSMLPWKWGQTAIFQRINLQGAIWSCLEKGGVCFKKARMRRVLTKAEVCICACFWN